MAPPRIRCLLARTSAALLTLLALLGAARAQAPAMAEYAVKSALLFKLPRFVYLPRFEGENTISICVLGRNPFGTALEKLAQQPIDGRTVQLRQPLTAGEAGRCDFVFIARSEAASLGPLLKKLAEYPVVTVSDIEGFANAGGMVEFALNKGDSTSLSIIINRQAASAQSVKFNAQLLRLAKVLDP